ncbi:rhodanese-like domain-containing protein [Romboutsia ilealis]|uniref:rhodanese-like domain-containing protein n=1 Tax=Romboutsia ilealis TaxID=1115758 RepID=UPI0027309A70|nr:rhodanese-like domain-containing protein [Romboutsia ilealis]
MSYKNISSNELKELIKNNENIIVRNVFFLGQDVRSEDEFEEINIETSINIPLQDLLYNIDELQDHNDKDIVIYCRSGHRSITACNLLAMEGFNKLYNLECGIIDYLK